MIPFLFLKIPYVCAAPSHFTVEVWTPRRQVEMVLSSWYPGESFNDVTESVMEATFLMNKPTVSPTGFAQS